MNKTLEPMTEEEMKDAIRHIFKKCQIDPVFRSLCLNNPKEALQQVTGKALPHGSNVVFKEVEHRQ